MSTTALDPKLAPYGEVTVRTVSDDTLVSALVVLTHQIDHMRSEATKEDLRAQRDMVRAEVLRRMGGAR